MDNELVSWDYKKITLGILLLGILGLVVYQNRELILSYNTPAKEVAGESTVKQKQSSQTKVVVPNIDLQEKITDITEQISQLDMQEVAASSPQVQKVLKDMESLKNLPKNEAKNACMQICSSL